MSDAPARCEVFEGDITTLAVDAIVNAANRELAPGAGVCGAIHRVAGPQLAVACRKVAPFPTGEARLTPGFALKARHVIHAVGPVWHGGDAGEAAALASCYRSALALARDHGLSSIAFPAISTGVYGFPADRAAAIAVATVGDFLAANAAIERVVFACFDAATATLYRRALAGPG
jgi:O-acetyl-ADP-ribose deacetylase (regulator of RNase III)